MPAPLAPSWWQPATMCWTTLWTGHQQTGDKVCDTQRAGSPHAQLTSSGWLAGSQAGRQHNMCQPAGRAGQQSTAASGTCTAATRQLPVCALPPSPCPHPINRARPGVPAERHAAALAGLTRPRGQHTGVLCAVCCGVEAEASTHCTGRMFRSCVHDCLLSTLGPRVRMLLSRCCFSRVSVCQVLVYFAVAKLGDAPTDGKTDVNPEGLTAGAAGHTQPPAQAGLGF